MQENDENKDRYPHQGETIERTASEERELTSDIKNVEAGSFPQIVNQYRDSITNYLYRLLDDYPKAVQIAESAFVDVYNTLADRRIEPSLSAYIFRAATNLALGGNSERKPNIAARVTRLFRSNEEANTRGPEVNSPWATNLIESEHDRRIVVALQALPGEDRAALLLRDVEAKSYDEIGRVLQLDVTSVRTRVTAARRLLMRELTK